jgi:Zn-dependent peptidase ImmA (M78 family)/DNA-binding XRE family transcriptional regulator
VSDAVSQRSIGFRVRAAREAKGWTQDELAALLRLENRQSVSDLENGKRSIRPDELVVLSDALERELDYFIEPFSVAGEAQFNWRVSPKVPESALNEFEDRSGSLVGLLRWLREQQASNTSALKRNLRLSQHSTFETAQARAEQLSVELALGSKPAHTLLEKVEKQLDIPVLMVDPDTLTSGSISGATCHLEEMSCILINRKESEARRAYDLAHELFHALTWEAMRPQRRETNVTHEGAPSGAKRIEQLADNFAAALLMPRGSVDELVKPGQPTRIARLREVAMALGVSNQALAWRLRGLDRIDEETCERLLHSHQPIAPLGVPKLYSADFVRLLREAIDAGRVSARKVAKALHLSLEQLTGLFGQYGLSAPFEL